MGTYDVSDVPPDLRAAVLSSNIKTEELLRDMRHDRDYILGMAENHELIDIIKDLITMNEKLKLDLYNMKKRS